MQRLQQIGRQPAQERVFLEGIHHPNHRELAHQKCTEEITIQSDTIEPQIRPSRTATPEAEHDERQHTGEGPKGNLSPVLEHVGVLAAEQSGHDAAIETEDPHQRLPWRNRSPIN